MTSPKFPNHPYFNPRSPHRERRDGLPALMMADQFQSTLPSQGATLLSASAQDVRTYFNPRSPHRERLLDLYVNLCNDYISIHAPLTGSDAVVSNADWRSCISIHAPLTGSDTDFLRVRRLNRDFNPRSPHRERRSLLHSLRKNFLFQSTLPSQGATIHSDSLSFLI